MNINNSCQAKSAYSVPRHCAKLLYVHYLIKPLSNPMRFNSVTTHILQIKKTRSKEGK